MQPKPLKDCAPGDVVYTTERMGDDRNRMEVREVFYIRDPDGPCRYDYNVRCARIGIVQGDPKDEDAVYPRHARMDRPPSRDPGEADGRTLVYPLTDGGSVWAHLYIEQLSTLLTRNA